MGGRDLGEQIALASLEAEQAVLGALMQSPDALELIGDAVAAVDFYTTEHADIFTACVGLIRDKQLAEPLAVAERLKTAGKLREGMVEMLVDIEGSASGLANARLYAEMVHERAIKRALAAAALKLGDMVHREVGKSPAQLLDEAQNLLAAVDARSNRGRGNFRSLAEAVSEVVDQLDAGKTAADAAGLRTGFADLDRVLNPMTPGQLIMVGARPSVGKTSFAVNIGTHVALTGARVAMFSMEMTDVELAVRILSAQSAIAAGRFREHRLEAKNWDRINEAVSRLSEVTFYIDETGGLSVQDLTARARQQARRMGGMDLLIVDYLQLSRAEGRYDNRAVELSAVSSGLKRLAKELQCPIIALSQLNRESAKGKVKPSVHELRDSGALEQDADTVLLLHRPYVHTHDEAQKWDAEVIIGKQRNGAIGDVPLDYEPALTQFFDAGQAPSRRRQEARGYSAGKNGGEE